MKPILNKMYNILVSWAIFVQEINDQHFRKKLENHV